MLRFGFLVAFAGFLTLAEHKDLVRGAEPPPAIAGKWETLVSWAFKGSEEMQTLEFREGRMIWIEPRKPGDKDKKTGFRIEAEYVVSKTGRIYGMVTLAGGATKADEGDTFSFIPRLDKGSLRLEDMRGNAITEEMLQKVGWKLAP